MRVEANLLDIRCLRTFYYSKCMTREYLTLKMKVKVVRYKHSQWCHSILISVECLWCILHSSHRFRDINVSNLGPCKFRSRSQTATVATVSIDCEQQSIKVIIQHLFIALAVFEIFTFQNSCSWKCRSMSWRTTFAVAPFDSKYLHFPAFTR